MFRRTYEALTFLLISCLVVIAFLLSAFNTPVLANAASSSHLASPTSVNVSTSCPAAGTGRAAVLPPLKLGNHQNMVYVSEQFSSSGMPLGSTLKRYDAVTKSTTTILTLGGQTIQTAQISADGQWILYVVTVNVQGTFQNRLQLIRMDAQYLQTLYCSAEGPFDVQWSTNQKLIVFLQNNATGQSVDLLNTTNGVVQTELTVSNANLINLRTWLDNKRIYLTNVNIDQPPSIAYILDTSKGPNQRLSDLLTVFSHTFNDFDSSYDTTKLFVDSCSCGQGGDIGPSTITVQPATGGQEHTIYSTSKYAATSIRSVTSNTLLFTINTFSPVGGADASHNGLWKMKNDGSGLTRLTTASGNQFTDFNFYSQFPWSNVSRDNRLYAAVLSGSVNGVFQQALVIGSLNGGPTTTFASFSGNGTSLAPIGWTTM